MKPKPKRAFLQTLTKEQMEELGKIAKESGLTLQELLRARVIPEWMRDQRKPEFRESVTVAA